MHLILRPKSEKFLILLEALKQIGSCANLTEGSTKAKALKAETFRLISGRDT
jgi:hypothetical protein